MARRPSIYASIVPGLPELPVDADRQTRLDALKEKFKKDPPVKIAKIYTELRNELKRLAEEESTANLALEAITQILCESQMRGEDGWGSYGTTSNTLPLANGDRVRIDVEPYATVADRDAFREWAIKEGFGNMLSLPWSTINSVTKKRLLAGDPEPPGVKTYKKRVIVFTPMKQAQKEDAVPDWNPDDVPDIDI